MLAYEALEARDTARLIELLDAASRARPRPRHERERPARHGGPARARAAPARARRRPEPRQRLRLDEAPPGRLRRTTPSSRELMLAAGGRLDLSARGDGGTPLVAALFWGHREVVPLLGLEPRNLRVAAGLGDSDLIRELARHARRRRPPRLLPPARRLSRVAARRDDPQEVLDEALVWAAKSDRVEVLGPLVELGARVDADPYRGTALTWAAVERPGRVGPQARRSRRRRRPARHLRRARPRRGRDRPPSRRAGRPPRGGRDAARARRRPDDRRHAPRRHRRRAGPSFGGHAELAERLGVLEASEPAKSAAEPDGRRRARAPPQPRTRTRCPASASRCPKLPRTCW